MLVINSNDVNPHLTGNRKGESLSICWAAIDG